MVPIGHQKPLPFDRLLLVGGFLVLLLLTPLGARGGGPVVEVGSAIQFSDLSTAAPTSWVWDFDYDGISPAVDSTGENPIWTFNEARTFMVYLEVCNAVGCSEVVKDVVVAEQVLPGLIFASGFETGNLDDWN